MIRESAMLEAERQMCDGKDTCIYKTITSSDPQRPPTIKANNITEDGQ